MLRLFLPPIICRGYMSYFGSNQTIILVFATSLLSTGHYEVGAKNCWLGITIICRHFLMFVKQIYHNELALNDWRICCFQIWNRKITNHLLTLCEHLGTPTWFLVRSILFMFLVFCVVLCFAFDLLYFCLFDWFYFASSYFVCKCLNSKAKITRLLFTFCECLILVLKTRLKVNK
jgi:hypothetical protein